MARTDRHPKRENSEVRRQPTIDGNREKGMAGRKEMVGATDKEVARAVREYEQAVAKSKELDREYGKVLERKKLEAEFKREDEQELEYEQDYDRDDYDEPSR